jgi:hypothetical protein
MSKTVYEAMVMPVDDTEPVYASRLATTKERAKEEVLDASHDVILPTTRHNLDWDDRVVERDGWQFVLKERELHND